MSVGMLDYDMGAKYGGSLRTPNPQHADTPLAQITKAAPQQNQPLYHPDHPLMAFAVIVGVTAGLLAFSGSVRVGRTKASASVGDTGGN